MYWLWWIGLVHESVLAIGGKSQTNYVISAQLPNKSSLALIDHDLHRRIPYRWILEKEKKRTNEEEEDMNKGNDKMKKNQRGEKQKKDIEVECTGYCELY